jgi:alpha-N-arabinofuranosidase
MIMTKHVTLPILLLLASQAQAQAITTSVDARKTRAPISRYVYGQFIEHIGGIINHGIWAEMLDDRKFYEPITSKPPAGAAPRGRFAPKPWTPVGPDHSVVMDGQRPYAGDHAALVRLDGTAAHGIRQVGLSVRKGKSYTGRVVLAGDSGAQVTVSLAWGASASERQAVTLGRLGAEYATFPLRFEAQADSDDAQIETTGTGVGSFRIGAASLMPADNVEGFRPEVIAALKQLRSGVYRFPGGNFVSAHEWRDAIGDRDRRPPTLDPAWNTVRPNDVGTDEFLTLCRLLDVEPYITVNAGFGDA